MPSRLDAAPVVPGPRREVQAEPLASGDPELEPKQNGDEVVDEREVAVEGCYRPLLDLDLSFRSPRSAASSTTIAAQCATLRLSAAATRMIVS